MGLDNIDAALAAAEQKKKGSTAYKEADSVHAIASRMGRGQPKKQEEEKATNKITLYFNDAEIKDIEEAAEINGFGAKDKNKYLKSVIRKIIRSELKQFGR